MENKFFMWYDSSRKDWPICGPHYYGDAKLIGKKCYHSLEELLKMSIADSLKKRLISAKIGTRIKVHYLHSCGDLMLKRIDDDQVKALNEAIKIDEEISALNEKAESLKKNRNSFLHKLYNKK